MALEVLTGTKYIDSLVSTNPAVGDTRTEGDDHLRGIKNVLKLSFPNISGAMTSSHTELNYNDGVTPGTVTASKTVMVDGSKDVGTFGTVTAATFAGTNVTGALDGVVGGVTPAAITGTTIKANTSLELATGATVTGILDEDAMGSDSATQLATQQSIKAYVDTASITYSSKSATKTISGLAGGTQVVAHGLGAAPDHVEWYLLCDTGHDNWVAGDRIFAASWQTGTNLTEALTVMADATNVKVNVDNTNNQVRAVDDGGDLSILTLANWSFVCKASIWA